MGRQQDWGTATDFDHPMGINQNRGKIGAEFSAWS